MNSNISNTLNISSRKSRFRPNSASKRQLNLFKKYIPKDAPPPILYTLPNTQKKRTGMGNKIEREQLYENNMQLKDIINHLRKELAEVKNKVVKKDIEIKELETLTLLTNLDFTNKKEYDFLLSLLNYNWIHKYVITFNGSGEGYNTDEIAANMKFLVPNLLASKLVSKRELKVLEDIKDKTEFYYWGLKYMFNVKMKDNPLVKENKKGNKKLIFDILKYINIVKSPELTHIYSIKN